MFNREYLQYFAETSPGLMLRSSENLHGLMLYTQISLPFPTLPSLHLDQRFFKRRYVLMVWYNKIRQAYTQHSDFIIFIEKYRPQSDQLLALFSSSFLVIILKINNYTVQEYSSLQIGFTLSMIRSSYDCFVLV